MLRGTRQEDHHKMTVTCGLMLLLLQLSSAQNNNGTRVPGVLNVGLIASLLSPGYYASTMSAMTIAFNTLKANGYLRNLTINITWLTDGAYDNTITLGNAIYLSNVIGVDVMFGPPTTQVGAMTGYYMNVINMPWFGWVLRDPSFSNTTLYPTLTKATGSYSWLGRATAELMTYFNWTNVAMFVYMNQANSPVCYAYGSSLLQWLPYYNVSISYSYVFSQLPSAFDLTSQMLSMGRQARIILMCAMTGDTRTIMLSAYAAGLTTPDYVWLTTPDIKSWSNLNVWQNYDANDPIALQAYQRLFFMTFDYFALPLNLTFSSMVISGLQQPPWNIQNPTGPADGYAPFLYDITYLYGMVLNDSLAQGINIRNGVAMHNACANRSFTGLTGPVVMAPDGTRITSFYTWCIDPLSLNYTPCVFQQVQNIFNNRQQTTRNLFTTSYVQSVQWGTASGNAPPAIPVCGYSNELCQASTSINIGLVVGLCCAGVLITTAIGVFVWMRIQSANLRDQLSWKVERVDVIFKVKGETPSARSGSLSTVGTEHTQISQSEATGSSGHTSKIAGLQDNRVELATYLGDMVIIKRIKHVNPNLYSTACLLNLKNMRGLNHPNVSIFLGACVHDTMDAFVISQFCHRGSLQDVIKATANNEQFQLDNSFKMSFISDLARGMDFIHESPLRIHGNLKSSNCLVDIRWTVKVADFGLNNLRIQLIDEKAMDLNAMYKDMYWTAPEILRDHRNHSEGTQAGDVYSFAIVLYEIIFEKEPYENEHAQEVIAILRSRVEPPYRPKVSETTLHAGFMKLMKDSWADDPAHRPSFSKIRQRCKDYCGGKDIVLIDEMLLKMERYTQQLEETVQQRTAQLAEEKRNADQLLYRMLPASIAECLKMGRTVPPESFTCASIMFTDIVRFTVIAGHSTPYQVVNLLNTLYNDFDAVIRSHDAYKVETIGDAYMIVSGLPIRNGNKHASALADVALNFLSVVLGFKIEHLPDVPLMIRAGIDSGPVCSGVIGNLMPHYCLFGDTVNSASRMESHGQPLMIHVTENTKDILLSFGTYVCAPRGPVNINPTRTMPVQRRPGPWSLD